MVNNSSVSGTNNTQMSTNYFNSEELVAWCFGFGVIDVVIIVSNTIAIVVFTRSKLLRKRTNYFLLCLAIADMMVGAISLPLFIHTLVVFARGDVLENNNLDMISTSLDIYSGFASVFTLTTIALERLYSVALPNWHRTTPAYVYCILISGIWTLAGVPVCIRLLAYKEKVTTGVFNITTSVFFLICLMVICLAYIGIWIKVIQRMHEKTKKTLEKDKRLATTLFLVTAIFVITWLPFQAINIVAPKWCEENNGCPKMVFIFAYLTKFLQYTNSFINPIIYTFKMPDFRRVFLGLFGRRSYGASTRATSRMITERRKRASTVRSSESAEANGNCEHAL
ncbi:hypothetical protein ACROYT_G016922 [Oculina patagonica]